MTELAKFDDAFGRELVTAAKETRRKRLQEQCIGEIENVIALIELQENRVKLEQAKLDLFKKRLAAIEAGNVKVQAANGQAQIVYLDDELNSDVEPIAGKKRGPDPHRNTVQNPIVDGAGYSSRGY